MSMVRWLDAVEWGFMKAWEPNQRDAIRKGDHGSSIRLEARAIP